MMRIALVLAAAALLAACGGDGPTETCRLVCNGGACEQVCQLPTPTPQ